MQKPLIFPSLQEQLAQADGSAHEEVLQQLCDTTHPADLAAQLDELTLEQATELLARLHPECCADVLVHMDYDGQRELAGHLPDEKLAAIIARMSSDDRVDLIQALPQERGETLLHLLARAEREDIRKLCAYPEGSAGAIMTSEYATLNPELTVRQAIDKLRLEAPDKETIYYAYVIDPQRRLLGLVSLRQLILARPDNRIADVMRCDLAFARANEDQEEVARKMAKYDLLAIPVINGNDALVGIVTFDDAHDVTEAEATEDFHRMGSIANDVGADSLMNVSLRDASIWLMVQKRLPWLLALVFMNIFSGAGIALFEDTIQTAVSLVFFLPLLIGSGGNAGAQSGTLMVRALALGDVRIKDWVHLLGKEILIALCIGVVMGLAVSLIGIFRAGLSITIVVALTMVLIVLFGSLLGMSLPFLLTRFNMDPATASAPLITSLADIGGVLIYFSIASWFLGIYTQ